MMGEQGRVESKASSSSLWLFRTDRDRRTKTQQAGKAAATARSIPLTADVISRSSIPSGIHGRIPCFGEGRTCLYPGGLKARSMPSAIVDACGARPLHANPDQIKNCGWDGEELVK